MGRIVRHREILYHTQTGSGHRRHRQAQAGTDRHNCTCTEIRRSRLITKAFLSPWTETLEHLRLPSLISFFSPSLILSLSFSSLSRAMAVRLGGLRHCVAPIGTTVGALVVLAAVCAAVQTRGTGWGHTEQQGGARVHAGVTATPTCDPAKIAPAFVPACRAANVLMQSSYSELTGAFKDTQFWGAANGLHALVDLMERSGDRSFTGVLHTARLRKSWELVELEGVGSFDDMQWWSLMYLSAARLLGGKGTQEGTAFLSDGQKIFDHVWAEASDNKTCGGGVYWSSKRGYKNAITNELAIANAALLHHLIPGDTVYLARAELQWQWLNHSGMIGRFNLVADGLHELKNGTCVSNGDATCCQGRYTYNQGVVLGALADMYTALHDESLLLAGARIADAVLTHEVNTDGVLVEPETISSQDGALFKGIFARNLAAFADVLPASMAKLQTTYRSFLQANRVSALAKASKSHYCTVCNIPLPFQKAPKSAM